VYSYDTKIGDTAGKEELMEAIKFFFMSVKERVDNPIGPLLLDYLQEKVEKLYNYFCKTKQQKRGFGYKENHTCDSSTFFLWIQYNLE
jgi:hypothetical protein